MFSAVPMSQSYAPSSERSQLMATSAKSARRQVEGDRGWAFPNAFGDSDFPVPTLVDEPDPASTTVLPSRNVRNQVLVQPRSNGMPSMMSSGPRAVDDATVESKPPASPLKQLLVKALVNWLGCTGASYFFQPLEVMRVVVQEAYGKGTTIPQEVKGRVAQAGIRSTFWGGEYAVSNGGRRALKLLLMWLYGKGFDVMDGGKKDSKLPESFQDFYYDYLRPLMTAPLVGLLESAVFSPVERMAIIKMAVDEVTKEPKVAGLKGTVQWISEHGVRGLYEGAGAGALKYTGINAGVGVGLAIHLPEYEQENREKGWADPTPTIGQNLKAMSKGSFYGCVITGGGYFDRLSTMQRDFATVGVEKTLRECAQIDLQDMENSLSRCERGGRPVLSARMVTGVAPIATWVKWGAIRLTALPAFVTGYAAVEECFARWSRL